MQQKKQEKHKKLQQKQEKEQALKRRQQQEHCLQDAQVALLQRRRVCRGMPGPGGRGDVTDTHVAWATSRGSPFIPSPVAYDGYLYTINDMSSIITCFDAATGTVMWQQRLGRARREGISASPVVVNDKVFVTNDDGITFVLKTGPEFALLHTNDIGAQTLASPALVDGIWYIRTVDELIAIGY